MVTKVEQITDNANSYLTSTTSVEDIRAYLLALANKVAKALDLKVMPKLTKELTYGGAYYLGESEDAEYPLMMVVNSNHQSFSYMYVYIGGVNKLGYQYDSSSYLAVAPNVCYTPSTNANGYLGVWISSNTQSASDNVYMTIKKYKDITAFSFFNKSSEWNGKYYFYLQKIKNKKTFSSMVEYGNSDSLYIGYTPALNNINNSSGSYIIMSKDSVAIFKSLVPENKDILQDLYIIDRQNPSPFKIFTNKANYSANDIITLQNKTYHIVWGGGSNYCLLIDITNEVEEKPSIEGGSTIQ